MQQSATGLMGMLSMWLLIKVLGKLEFCPEYDMKVQLNDYQSCYSF